MYKNPYKRIAYGILEHMKVGGSQRGFTIIETLIVLAVTGALFVMIMVVVSGRTARSEFSQSIEDIRSQIQQVINETTTGYYANFGDFKCTASAAGPVLTPGATAQGENSDCIFMGKVIQFGLSGTDPEQFAVYPIAGLRERAGGGSPTTLVEAKPEVIAPSTPSPAIPDATELKRLLYGLTTKEVYYGSPKVAVGAIAFMSSLASYSGDSLISGSQQLNVYPIAGSSLNSTSPNAVQTINANIEGSPLNPTTGVSLCFVSGGTDQSGLITIGGSGRQLSVTLSIKGNKTCT